MAELVLKNKQYLFPKATVRGSKVHHPDLDAVRISLDLKETVFSGGQRVEVKWRSTSELSQSQEGTLELQRLVCVALRHSASILQTLTRHHKPMVSKQIYASEKSPLSKNFRSSKNNYNKYIQPFLYMPCFCTKSLPDLTEKAEYLESIITQNS